MHSKAGSCSSMTWSHQPPPSPYQHRWPLRNPARASWPRRSGCSATRCIRSAMRPCSWLRAATATTPPFMRFETELSHPSQVCASSQMHNIRLPETSSLKYQTSPTRAQLCPAQTRSANAAVALQSLPCRPLCVGLPNRPAAQRKTSCWPRQAAVTCTSSIARKVAPPCSCHPPAA